MPIAHKQSDPEWASEIVGFGTRSQTFKNVGCVMCVMSYFWNDVTGENITPLEFRILEKKFHEFMLKLNVSRAIFSIIAGAIGAIIVYVFSNLTNILKFFSIIHYF